MKKWLIWGGLVVVVIAAAGGVWFWSKYGVFIKMKPGEPFDLAKAPPEPDYSQEMYWAALPTTQDEADLVPDGIEGGDAQAVAEADVFFIYPTTYARPTWNAPMDPDSRSREYIERLLAGEASSFNGCCKVYAPHYRQATLYAFFTEEDDGLDALQLAYGDVRNAFRYFIEHHNEGRPFLIASHSQGTLHAYRLLREEIGPTALRDRLVAAYTLGYPLPLERFGTEYENLRPCSEPDETGCMIGWETWGEETEPTDWVFPLWNGERLERIASPSHSLCVNPLSWKADSARAGADLHLGAVVLPEVPDDHYYSGPEHTGRKVTALAEPLWNHTHARCGDRALFVALQSDPPYSSMLTEGNYHPHDFFMFYMNIRENAIKRTHAWLAANSD